MNWLAFAFALELGAIRGSEIPVDLSSYVQMESTAIVLDHLEIGGVLRSYQVPYKETYFWPFRMDYTVSATVKLGDVSFGAEHVCVHPVVPWSEQQYPASDTWSQRVFVRISHNPVVDH